MTGMRMLGPLNGGPAAPPDPELNLDDPETNYMAMLKIRGDLSGKDFIFAFPGEAWGSVPGEGYRRLFKTFGIGAGRIEEVPEGWRIYNREVLYYLDLETGKVMDQWQNPFLAGRKVDVFHIANDPVNGVFKREGSSVLAPPYPYIAYGDCIAFRWDFYIYRPSHMTRAEYPLYSAGDMDQHAELWGIQGRRSDVLNPDITSGECTLSWSRIAQWLPFMEMGNIPGSMIFHSACIKLRGGVSELPRYMLDYTEKHYPKYLEAPTEWNGPVMTSAAGEFKKMIDSKRAAESD
jgi:hypothetical protein